MVHACRFAPILRTGMTWSNRHTLHSKISSGTIANSFFVRSQYHFKKRSNYIVQRKTFSDHSNRIHFPHFKVFASDRVGGFVKNLNELERQQLYSELQKYQLECNDKDPCKTGNSSSTVTPIQLRWLFFYNCAPFIGFGFLDNAIMILAGEYIDLTIGCALGISTMAAAALGNLISDLAGLGLAGYVEILCGKMGLPIPDLSTRQMELRASRFASNSGKALGVAIGCLLGMFPLLFLKERPETKEENEA